MGNPVHCDFAEPLLILGASTRAAAESARRAFFAPITADLFADLDLQENCPATRVDDYPRGFTEFLQQAPAGDWLYTGALENYPELVEQWSATRRLLGNGGDVLRRARDPVQLAACLRRSGLPSPAVAMSDAGLPRDGTWLRKALHSAGGNHIDLWSDTAAASPLDRPVCFQQRVTGLPCSAVYVATQGNAVLLGVTEQLLSADSFCYAGSIGPLVLTAPQHSQVTAIGQALAAEFGLSGLFGVDVLLNAEGFWPVEVNPRYTASVEVLERATGIAAIALHVRACREASLPQPLCESVTGARVVVGKAILFAATDFTVTCDLRRAIPNLADVPPPGTRIRQHHPIATVLCSGNTPEEVRQSLLAAKKEAGTHIPIL